MTSTTDNTLATKAAGGSKEDSTPCRGSAASPWNGLVLIITLPVLVVGGAFIGACYGIYKAVQGGVWSAYHRGCGDWVFINPPNDPSSATAATRRPD